MAVTEERRVYLREKKREARERARAAGRCIICTNRPADAELVTCSECRSDVLDWRRSKGWPEYGDKS
jgi:hypothetical protein